MGTAYRRLLHQERCFEQFFKEYPLSHCFILLFYICFLCFHSQRSFGFGESGLLFLSGKHSSTVVHTKLTIVSGLFFFIYHNTTWLDPGAGIWMHLQLGRDSIQAACFFWPFSFRHLWFSRKRRIRSNARRSALVRDRNSLRILR